MYKHHKYIVGTLFIVVSLLGFLLEINYAQVANEAITIVSIALGVYIASFSQLASSDLAKVMKNTADKKIPQKSQMGVLSQYLKVAFLFGILNIVMSCICLLRIVPQIILAYDVLSSLALGVLSMNFVFIWLLFEFMINRQLRE